MTRRIRCIRGAARPPQRRARESRAATRCVPGATSTALTSTSSSGGHRQALRGAFFDEAGYPPIARRAAETPGRHHKRAERHQRREHREKQARSPSGSDIEGRDRGRGEATHGRRRPPTSGQTRAAGSTRHRRRTAAEKRAKAFVVVSRATYNRFCDERSNHQHQAVLPVALARLGLTGLALGAWAHRSVDGWTICAKSGGRHRGRAALARVDVDGDRAVVGQRDRHPARGARPPEPRATVKSSRLRDGRRQRIAPFRPRTARTPGAAENRSSGDRCRKRTTRRGPALAPLEQRRRAVAELRGHTPTRPARRATRGRSGPGRDSPPARRTGRKIGCRRSVAASVNGPACSLAVSAGSQSNIVGKDRRLDVRRRGNQQAAAGAHERP